MGGKALNRYGVITERKDTKNFHKIAHQIQDRINNDFNGLLETSIVRCYHNKSDHGDLDLLLKISHDFHKLGLNMKIYINNTFKPKAIHKNDSVYSFDYNNFQIDFILIRESKWETAKTYYSYDPLGNAMGKTFHKFGLSYGWDGLFYKFRNFNGRNSQNILLSNNASEIFKFGGYNYERYLMGFDDIEDIFNFIINGKYFDSEIFKMENLKSIDRKRNRKRGSYHAFLKYIEENNIKTSYRFNRDKSTYLDMINNSFPNVKFLEKLENIRKNDELNNLLANKFNGNIIMSWYPDLKGKKLGESINGFKKMLGNKYKNFILENDVSEIRKTFTKYYEGIS